MSCAKGVSCFKIQAHTFKLLWDSKYKWCVLVVEERPRSEGVFLTCANGVSSILLIRDLKSRLTLINRCVTQNLSGEFTK